jgi:hypothetical protein
LTTLGPPGLPAVERLPVRYLAARARSS